MVELHIKIRKRIARLAYGENFVSYNEGYKIIFDFDKEWDSIENKTARFIFGENYIDYPFNGNEVEIPLIKNADTLEIGVYSDNLYTTTAVKFKVLKSIKDEEKIEILVPEAYPEIEELDDEDLIRVYDKSEEKIGISPLKKLFDKMGVAIDDALTQAKESGEFDGKSAYSYAVDGGYLGTEEEFAAKLAAKSIDKALFVVNITSNSDGTYSADKTIGEIIDVYNEGKYNIVANAMGANIIPFLAITERGFAVFGGIVDMAYNTFTITPDNRVKMKMFQLATLKDTLPNPYPLTFTGAVNETYDGSNAKTIEIPSGGGGDNELTLLANINFDGNTANGFEYTGLDDVSEIYIVGAEIKSGLDNSRSSFSLKINDIEISAGGVLNIQKASETDTWNNYYIAKFNGAFWEPLKSPTHGGANPVGHTTSPLYPNSVVLDVGKAKKLYLYVANPSYKPVAGWMKIWVR